MSYNHVIDYWKKVTNAPRSIEIFFLRYKNYSLREIHIDSIDYLFKMYYLHKHDQETSIQIPMYLYKYYSYEQRIMTLNKSNPDTIGDIIDFWNVHRNESNISLKKSIKSVNNFFSKYQDDIENIYLPILIYLSNLKDFIVSKSKHSPPEIPQELI